MQGIVETCSAPVAVTRRCPFPASSSSNPAESASRATAACTPPAPALISNWINPSLPHQIKAPALTQRGAAAPTPPRVTGGFSEGRGWGEVGAVHFGGQGVGHRLAGQAWQPFRWLLGFSFPGRSPSALCPRCVYVSTRACVCVYNNIYLSVCLLEDCGSGKGAGARASSPGCVSPSHW